MKKANDMMDKMSIKKFQPEKINLFKFEGKILISMKGVTENRSMFIQLHIS